MSKKIYDAIEDYDEIKELLNYAERFDMHYKLLLRRYERFKQVNDPMNMDIDVITYLDMIVVQIRAMCIESPNRTKNYTIQNLARKFEENEIADRLDAMLDQDMFSYMPGVSIRKALKLLADKFICHYDEIPTLEDLEWAERIEKRLRSPYEEHNLDEIMGVVQECIGDGLRLKLVKNETDDNIEESC